jgi:hypothetical protein
MTELKRAVLGFLVATTIPAAVLSIFWPLGGEHRIDAILGSFAVAYPFSAGFTISLGLPAFLVLRPFRPGNWWSAVVVGIILGAVVAMLIRRGHLFPEDLANFCAIGGLTAFVFWLIWKPEGKTGADA